MEYHRDLYTSELVKGRVVSQYSASHRSTHRDADLKVGRFLDTPGAVRGAPDSLNNRLYSLSVQR